MVDPKQTNTRSDEAEAARGHARRLWIKPVLETVDVDETEASNTVGTDGGVPLSSLS
ncbi:MAG TPA: hypothetical protein VG248_19685 [Caulobacteraceae bacterium]|jgi:hypothetical protein|nr:hypothetical protein [Caulobacteraceae bacterium]